MTEVNSSPLKETPKKIHVETWGCQMNVADSERMLALLANHNYSVTEKAEDADLILLNTCHIREKARHKVLSRLGVLKELKEKHPGTKIAVTGCVAQADGVKLLKQAPQIDVLLGPGKIDELPKLLSDNQLQGKPAVALGFRKGEATEGTPLPTISERPTLSGKNEVSRYVNIQQGCNNFCTFCVVPFTRGREISRSLTEVYDECREMVENGAKEITVLGQNVNSYGLDLVASNQVAASPDGPFVDLLRKVAGIPNLERLRFTTSNPHDFSQSLAQLFATQPKMGRYIHLPVQSGDDRVLQVMKRKVTRSEFDQRVAWLRAAIPDMAISTDLIVGFPSETDEEFEQTVDLVQKTQFSFIFSFKYSPRRGTAAARFKDQIPEDLKEKRLAKLNQVQDAITTSQNEREIGQEREVLFIYESKKNPGHYYGRTQHYRLVRVKSHRNLVGLTAMVKVTEANKTALVGNLV